MKFGRERAGADIKASSYAVEGFVDRGLQVKGSMRPPFVTWYRRWLRSTKLVIHIGEKPARPRKGRISWLAVGQGMVAMKALHLSVTAQVVGVSMRPR